MARIGADDKPANAGASVRTNYVIAAYIDVTTISHHFIKLTSNNSNDKVARSNFAFILRFSILYLFVTIISILNVVVS